jgi:hypothetical protein
MKRFLILFALAACGVYYFKNEIKDLSQAPIEIVYPLDIPELVPGQPLCLKAIINGNRQIFLISWKIFDNSSTKQLYLEEFRPQGKSYVLESEHIM